MTRLNMLLAVAVLASLSASNGAERPNVSTAQSRSPSQGWPAYGGGPEQIRYSTLSQINRSNVAQLEVAWTYDSGETGGLQTNPIIVEGVIYTTTPKHKVVAIDAATGKVRWKFDSKIEGSGPNRGVTYWASGDDRRIFAGQGHYIYALDARTGEPVDRFGSDGRIDLRDDLGRPADAQSVRLTSPGVVYKDLLIVGGRVSEGLPASPGHIRAYDVNSGNSAGSSTPSLTRASLVMRRGRKMLGRTSAAQTTGPGWRSIISAASFTPPQDRQRLTSTGQIDSATTSSPIRCLR